MFFWSLKSMLLPINTIYCSWRHCSTYTYLFNNNIMRWQRRGVYAIYVHDTLWVELGFILCNYIMLFFIVIKYFNLGKRKTRFKIFVIKWPIIGSFDITYFFIPLKMVHLLLYIHRVLVIYVYILIANCNIIS